MKVALYIRRSTNERLQADSLKVQEQILRAYAREHSMKVVEVFTDSASGTSTKHRASFLQMVERITHGALFSAVLVRDVSRFGRFFDVDEGAFFEVLFLGHGVKTVYCEEVFASDTSPMASLVKSVRRVMASEYSRDRSRLTRYAQSRATRLGFHAKGPAPYGMRRVMITQDGRHVLDLGPGEWKALANHRVRLVAGDPEAVSTVRRIFDLYDGDKLEPSAIARALNESGIASPKGLRWCEQSVSNVLSNSVYAGLARYQPRRNGLSDPLPVSQVESLAVWDAPGPEAIIEVEQFRRVEMRLSRRTSRRSNATLATEARAAFEEHGCVEPAMLDRLPLHCSWGAYRTRFRRGINEALERAFATEIENRTGSIVELLRGAMDVSQREDLWIADGTLRIRIQAMFPHRRGASVHWRIRPPSVACDVVISFCVNASHSDKDVLYLVQASRLTRRPRGLYLPHCGRRMTRLRVAADALGARIARMRFTSGEPSEVRLLQEARAHALVNFAELARTLDWPHHVVRKMYWRLAARGEWFPPLQKRAGRRVEIVCVQCGRSRLERPVLALKLRSGRCVICTRARPKHRVVIRCPRCGRERECWPSNVRALSSGAETVCRRCRARAGLKQASAPAASADKASP